MTREETGVATLPADSLARLVYGSEPIPTDDPAENYHEASKISPALAARQAPGVSALETDSAMRERIWRASRPHRQRRSVAIEGRAELAMSLGKTIGTRRSAREFSADPLSLDIVAALIEAAYGLTANAPPLRSVPSGGALYPLELYVFALSVDALPAGIFHFSPLDCALEEIQSGDPREALSEAFIHPEIAEQAGVFVAVTAVFWRTRFKYGLRGYRFCLLEAGHVIQNMLLAATALDLAAVPVGGYFDHRLDRLLRLDGVTESTIYGVALGRPGS